MTTWEFPCSGPAAIRITSWPSGSVALSAGPTEAISVEAVPASGARDLLDRIRVSFDNGRLTITGPDVRGFLRRHDGLDLTVRAPAGSDCEVHTAAADVACVGDFGTLTLSSASGDLTAASARGAVLAKTASGDVFIDQAGADVSIDTASGDVRVAHAGGELQAKTISGDVTVGDCDGPVTARTTSGDIEITELAAGRAELQSISGDATVAVRRGVSVYLDLSTLSGSVRSDLDADEDGADSGAALEIKCHTVSGDIRVRKGGAPAGASGGQSDTAA